jgi:hypothetical protein
MSTLQQRHCHALANCSCVLLIMHGVHIFSYNFIWTSVGYQGFCWCVSTTKWRRAAGTGGRLNGLFLVTISILVQTIGCWWFVHVWPGCCSSGRGAATWLVWGYCGGDGSVSATPPLQWALWVSFFYCMCSMVPDKSCHYLMFGLFRSVPYVRIYWIYKNLWWFIRMKCMVDGLVILVVWSIILVI